MHSTARMFVLAYFALASGAALCGGSANSADGCAVSITGLKVCRMTEPANIVKPVFSWRMETARRGATQKSYELELDTRDGAAVWRSGVVEDAFSHAVPYGGPPLESAKRYVWTVAVTDDAGKRTVSRPASFATGLLNEGDWNGSEWIAVAGADQTLSDEMRKRRCAMPGASCFAKRTENVKPVREAWWTVTGQGVFQAYVNGKPLPGFLKPGFDHVLKTRHSFTVDVTGMMRREGGASNVFSAIVTAGWWRDCVTGYRGRESAFRAQLVVRYDDGTEARFGTDREWLGAVAGPVVSAGIFDGEVYDARADALWMATGEGSGFSPVASCGEFKGGIVPMEGPGVSLREDLALRPQAMYVWKGVEGETGEAYGKVNVLRRYGPRDEVELKAGETLVVDFGQNAAAVPEFRFSAGEGTRLEAKAGETLCDGGGAKSRGNDGPEGGIYRGNLRFLREWGAKVEYVFAGGGEETYRPEFTYLGYRYLSVTATGDVRIREIASVPVSSIAQGDETGSLETGVEGVNRLVKNILWGQYSNYLSVPTDCPQRDERIGWTADTQVFCAAASRNADVYAFLKKWMRDMRDSQHGNGSFAGVAPPGLFGDDTERFGWSDAGVIVPYVMWKRYGDLSIVEENFDAIGRYMDLTARNKFDSPAANGFQWGDWVSFEALESHDGGAFETDENGVRRPKAEALVYWHFLGGCHWLQDARMCAEMAAALGRGDDAARYSGMAEEALAYVRRRFLEPDGMLPRCLRGMQTPALFALKFGIFESPDAAAATKAALLENISGHGGCLQTGFLGTPIILDVLSSDADGLKAAYSLLLQRKNPSWLYSVDQGATTVWERWNGYTKEDGFLKLSMKSFNHYAYGAVLEWMYGTMAGIMPDPESPGWRHFVLYPKPDRRMGRVSARFDSPYGAIESEWAYSPDGTLSWRFTVPPNTSATVRYPDGRVQECCAGTYGFDVLDDLMPVPAKVERTGGFADPCALDSVRFVRGPVPGAPEATADEAYVLEISRDGAKVAARGEDGERWARATLGQIAKLAAGGAVPCCRITDWPRLKWRGFMLDTVRNYLPVKDIKDVIDVMAQYKLNLFHWHLTENYAWRLESRRFPELQSERAFLHRHKGRFYTQEEFRDVVDYAYARGIRTMPEFDFPGHSLAFRRAFGIGKMSDPRVGGIAAELFTELCGLAPAEKMPFVHMGTDEVFKRDVEGATKEALEAMSAAIAACGRTVVSWVPGEEYDCRGPHVNMLWTDKVSPDTRPGPYFDADGMYIEDFDPFELLSVATYRKPARWHDAGGRNLGAVFCAWHDGFVGEKYANLLRNQPVFPSCVLFGNSFWRGRDRNLPAYRKRLPLAGDPLLAEAADIERRTAAQRDRVLGGLVHPFHFLRQTDMRWRMSGEDGGVIADGIAQATVSPGRFRDGDGNAPAASNRFVRLDTWIRSPERRTVGAWIGFTNISRDHGLVYSAPLPDVGEWNRFGATVEVNGEKVAPPAWQRPGLKRGEAIADWTPAWTLYEADEEPFTDQEYFMREPTPVELREGWNHVRLTVPNPAFADGGRHRWSATFALLDGTTGHPREAEGLEYSSSPPSAP